jgi:iron complex transport system substrate-binding protein
MSKQSIVRQPLAALLLLASALATGCGASSAPKAAEAPGSSLHRPHRVISLSATATESLFAIGAGGQVIAVDDQSDYPASAPRSKLSYLRPNAEAVAAYRPDLVVTPGEDAGFVAALRKLHLRVLVQPAARSLDDAYAQVRQLGTATGHPSAGRAVAARMRRRIDALVASVRRSAERISVYHELSPDAYSATSKTFIGSVYARFGLRNIADRAKGAAPDYPKLSRELILHENPALIVLADTTCCKQTPRTVAARPGWARLRAVRDGAVVTVSDAIASRWGPRTVQFVAAIAAVLRSQRS